MRAGWYERTGPAHDVIKVGDMDDPAPGPGEVLVRLHASGVNPSDYKRRANVKTPAEFPRVVPHSDGAGVVAALGPGAQGLRVGDRVWTFNAQWRRPFGTAAEFVALPLNRVKPLPVNVSFVEGACLGIPAMTGWRAAHVAGPPASKWVYVPGATGRVGAYAVQIAKWRGAKVIASTGGGETRRKEIEALGANLVLDRVAGDLEARILEATDGRGVDLIVEVDLPGNCAVDERILAEGGTIVSFGATQAPFFPLTLAGRRARNMGLSFIFVYLLDEAAFDSTCAGLIECASDGALKHRIAATFPLADLAKAHEFAETTSGTGHVVVTI